MLARGDSTAPSSGSKLDKQRLALRERLVHARGGARQPHLADIDPREALDHRQHAPGACSAGDPRRPAGRARWPPAGPCPAARARHRRAGIALGRLRGDQLGGDPVELEQDALAPVQDRDRVDHHGHALGRVVDRCGARSRPRAARGRGSAGARAAARRLAQLELLEQQRAAACSVRQRASSATPAISASAEPSRSRSARGWSPGSGSSGGGGHNNIPRRLAKQQLRRGEQRRAGYTVNHGTSSAIYARYPHSTHCSWACADLCVPLLTPSPTGRGDMFCLHHAVAWRP